MEYSRLEINKNYYVSISPNKITLVWIEEEDDGKMEDISLTRLVFYDWIESHIDQNHKQVRGSMLPFPAAASPKVQRADAMGTPFS